MSASQHSLCYFDTAASLYSKEAGGLVEGARAQFVKQYGDAEFLKLLGAKIAAEREHSLGRGKRQKFVPTKLRDYKLH